MNYQETLEFLFSQLPVFEAQGAHAYKPGLERCEAMDQLLGHPHRRFKTIHIAGSNGKGTTSHTLAAILQEAGMRVGLFTSPHLMDFSERIRVDGEEISHDYVVEWTATWHERMQDLRPSFFELATMMAFSYFADREVDVAIIEVGLGGRLDSTNIILPDLSIITNISMDHTQFLGETLPQIAAEKAGIMKKGVPCIIGECDDERVRFTFSQNAQLREAGRLLYACDNRQVLWVSETQREGLPHLAYETLSDGTLYSPLLGSWQPKNANTILCAVHVLREIGYPISDDALHRGFENVVRLTHLRGRWETLERRANGSTRVLCDTGHNEGCFQYIGPQLRGLIDKGEKLNIVFGMVRDKDISSVIGYLPPEAEYFFCNAPTPRALPAAELQALAASHGLKGESFPSVDAAFEAAYARPGMVFVGGSNFVVCEVMARYRK